MKTISKFPSEIYKFILDGEIENRINLLKDFTNDLSNHVDSLFENYHKIIRIGAIAENNFLKIIKLIMRI